MFFEIFSLSRLQIEPRVSKSLNEWKASLNEWVIIVLEKKGYNVKRCKKVRKKSLVEWMFKDLPRYHQAPSFLSAWLKYRPILSCCDMSDDLWIILFTTMSSMWTKAFQHYCHHWPISWHFESQWRYWLANRIEFLLFKKVAPNENCLVLGNSKLMTSLWIEKEVVFEGFLCGAPRQSLQLFVSRSCTMDWINVKLWLCCNY